jgi:hypothetical protein
MPAITSVAPASAAAGAAAQALTINGSGFTSNSTVTYNGAAHTASYVSSTQLTIQLSAADLSTAGSYDPSTGVFTLTGSLNIKRQFHTATLLNNGHVLLAGGMINGQATIGAELYDPTPGRFSVTGSMSTARSYQTATLLGNGFVLVAGGTTQLNTGVINTADLYDSSTGVFGQTGNMVTGRYGAAAAPLQ